MLILELYNVSNIKFIGLILFCRLFVFKFYIFKNNILKDFRWNENRFNIYLNKNIFDLFMDFLN